MGTLYVVATPIGNLGDISDRAKSVLSEVDFVLAEDTRNSGILLNRLGISKSLVSYHKFNEKERTDGVIARLNSGESCALITDAGTPCISDPGSVIVREARQAGISVVGIPGPSAVVLALSVSGFDVKDFAFYGFFPRSKGEREDFIKKITSDSITTAVFYESPKRIEECVESLSRLIPDCRLCVCNDLTKRFERVYTGSPEIVLSELCKNEKSELGEYAIVLEMQKTDEKRVEGHEVSIEARLFDKLLAGMDTKSAVKALQAEGVARNDAYTASLKVKEMLK